jgi:hypothetical protein
VLLLTVFSSLLSLSISFCDRGLKRLRRLTCPYADNGGSWFGFRVDEDICGGTRWLAMACAEHAGGLRVSEIVALDWGDMIERSDTTLQLNNTGKGGVIRNVVLPVEVSNTLRS